MTLTFLKKPHKAMKLNGRRYRLKVKQSGNGWWEVEAFKISSSFPAAGR